MYKFELQSKYKPTGDQPQAIEKLIEGFRKKHFKQTILGVTGSGKTFTMANVIQKMQLPTLVISHNKTLAAQLCQEFRAYFPKNAVEYFVSYYDYYQPEAYIPHTDTYIEKDASINDDIDRLRHRATRALLERKDVVVVASVSSIYGLGAPADYLKGMIRLNRKQNINPEQLFKQLVAIKYERNDFELKRGKFRRKGEVVEIWPAYEEYVLRLYFEEDILDKIVEVDIITGEVRSVMESVSIYPATHYVTFSEKLKEAAKSIQYELAQRLKVLNKENKLVEAQRLESRTKYDLELISEIGYCNGIENYSRHMDGRNPGDAPSTLIDYFPKKFLLFIDESHVTLPQLRAMYAGDKSRKERLIEYGFRLPSALDNRPLKFQEFEKKIDRLIYVSATPTPYEIKHSSQVVEQIIRPTGLIDPELVVKATKGQVDDLIKRINQRVAKKERVLVTTLTKRMAEDLSEYLSEEGIKVRYLHSDIKTLERIDILRGLRLGEFDVLVGINLLREGLDLPEVSLVAILDADKEGFLRSETSLIQTIGRAARNINGQVILYADKITRSMQLAIKETERRRKLQINYNKKNNIEPKTIIKEIKDIAEQIREAKISEVKRLKDFVPKEEVPEIIRSLEEEMQVASTELNFEQAAQIRDRIKEIKKAFGIK